MTQDPSMETPLAPIDLDAEAAPKRSRRQRRADRRSRPPKTEGLFASYRTGLLYMVSAWRVLLAVLIVHLLLAMTVVMPMQARMAKRLDAHAHAPSLAGNPDAYDAQFGEAGGWNEGGLARSVWDDAKRLEASLLDTQRITLYWIVLIAWLFGAVVAGGHLGLAVEGERPTVTGFLGHGARHFWRMLRVGLVFGLVYYVVGRIVLEMWGATAEVDEKWGSTTSEAGFYGKVLRNGVMVVVFLWLRVVCDLARADLIAFGRTSAVGAFFRGIGRTLRHPLRTLGLALFCGGPAFGMIAALSVVLGAFGFGSWLGIVAGFVVIELATLIRLGSRAALLAGDAQLVTAGVRMAMPPRS